LADVLHELPSRFERWLEDLLVVGALPGRRAGLGGDPEMASRQLGDLDGLDDALLRRHPADEAERLAATALERRLIERQPVVDDRGPLDIGMRSGLIL